jgi:hypothetical protein
LCQLVLLCVHVHLAWISVHLVERPAASRGTAATAPSTTPLLPPPPPLLLLLLLLLFPSHCRAPRLTWDCGLLSNRVQLAPNLTLTLKHLIVANCSTTKPFSIIRLSAGSRVLINDSVIVQPPGLCMPLQEQAASALHSARPAEFAGVQSISPGVAGAWCAHNASSNGAGGGTVVAGEGPGDNNSSYTAVRVTTDNLGLFANTTGGFAGAADVLLV